MMTTKHAIPFEALANPETTDEAVLRAQLAACYRLVAHFGMDDLIYNHISARVPGAEEHFLINPYGLLFSEVTASCFVKIDLEGRKVEPSDHAVNQAGFVIHSAIHAARPAHTFRGGNRRLRPRGGAAAGLPVRHALPGPYGRACL